MSSIGTGYDLSVTTFSLDGHVFQVEYATKAVDNSRTVVGIKCKDGIVLCVEKLVTSKMTLQGSKCEILVGLSGIFCPPFHTTNSREGSTTLNDSKPQTEARNLMGNSFLAARKPVLTDTASESCFYSESSKSFGNRIPCSGSTNLDGQGLLGCVEGPAVKDVLEGSKLNTENPTKQTFRLLQPTVYNEILELDSSEIVDSSHLLCLMNHLGLKIPLKN